ncbi:MAG: M16 family metallopeptidase [Cyclobacteriaceae bacterium]
MLDRKTQPPFAKEFSFDLPSPEFIPLNNGLQLVWVKDIQQEVVKLDFVFKAGKWYESKKGVAYFTAHMLEKGTAKLSSKKIAELLDQQGAQLEISTGADFTSIALYSLSKNFDKVIQVVFDILQESIFPEDELNLMTSIFIQNLKVNKEKNSFLASRALQKNIFGNDHPYGSSSDESDIEKINTSDLLSFHKNSFTPHEVYLTGNLNSIQLKSLTELLRNFSFKRIKPVEIQDVSLVPFEEKITKENSVQSSIRFGKITVRKSHPDYIPLLLLNHILGGYFGSRLMKNIREEKGLTYGIHSSVNSHLNASLISIGTDVNIDKLEITIDEIKKELLSLINIPIPKEELETAKNHFLGNLQLEVSNPFTVVEKIKYLRLNQLHSNYYTDLFDRVKTTSGSDLQAIANDQLNPSNFHIVSVGY